MTTPTNEEVRRQFEAWASDGGSFRHVLERNKDGEYTNVVTYRYWLAYQAALRSPAVVALVEAAKLEAEQAFLRDWLQFISYPIGMDCCGRGHGGDCCGDGVLAYPTISDAVQAMNKRLNEVEAALAPFTTGAGHVE